MATYSEETIQKAVSNGKTTTNGTLNKTSNVIVPDGQVNYNDARFQQVETDKTNALNQVDQMYGEMIGNVDDKYQALIDNSQKWADEQIKNQNEQTDFAIEKIEQEKEKAEKDYIKEQSGAYGDYIRQVDPYGVHAEQLAAMGLSNSGYAESSKVAMYTAYQNRVASAKEGYNNAVLNYNNAITDARLQNNSVIAEISYKALQEQLELALQGFQYKNQLILDQANKKIEVENNYYERYQDVLAQINQENALAEQIRQYNETLAEEKRQFNEQLALSKSKSSSSNYTSTGNTPKMVVDNDDKGNNDNVTYSNIAQAKMDLGYGPITDEAVVNAVNNGWVDVVTDKNGKDTLVRTSSAPATLTNENNKPVANTNAGAGLVKNVTLPVIGVSGKKVNLPSTPQVIR